MKFSQKMPLNVFYTMVQKKSKMTKNSNQGGPALISDDGRKKLQRMLSNKKYTYTPNGFLLILPYTHVMMTAYVFITFNFLATFGVFFFRCWGIHPPRGSLLLFPLSRKQWSFWAKWLGTMFPWRLTQHSRNPAKWSQASVKSQPKRRKPKRNQTRKRRRARRRFPTQELCALWRHCSQAEPSPMVSELMSRGTVKCGHNMGSTVISMSHRFVSLLIDKEAKDLKPSQSLIIDLRNQEKIYCFQNFQWKPFANCPL